MKVMRVTNGEENEIIIINVFEWRMNKKKVRKDTIEWSELSRGSKFSSGRLTLKTGDGGSILIIILFQPSFLSFSW